MSLQGTLETFALPDVLTLLASTNKTGQLHVEGSSNGRIWLEAGQMVGYDVPGAATLVDGVFELLRLRTGTFSFGGGDAPPAPADPSAVEPVLSEAQSRLADWRGIEAVVPSTRCPVHLVDELGEDTVTLSRAQWKVLVAVAASSDVAGVMTALDMGEFDACRTVKDLVQAGLARVDPAPTANPAPAVIPAPTADAAPAVSLATAPAASPPAERRPPAPPAAPPVPEPPVPAAPYIPQRPPTASSPASEQTNAVSPQARFSTMGRDEAEEMVHQLASLGSSSTNSPISVVNDGPEEEASPPPPAPTAKPDPTTTEQPTTKQPEPAVATPDEEPINRGMLLKFLSSVRA